MTMNNSVNKFVIHCFVYIVISSSRKTQAKEILAVGNCAKLSKKIISTIRNDFNIEGSRMKKV